jgi:hypothetical protein
MSLESNRKRIKQLLATAPKSWQKMFVSKGLPAKPKNIDQVIEKLLSLTPTERSSGPTGQKAHTPDACTRREAMKGLELSHRDNYTSASGIGLARAIQLATWPKIWDRSVRRMDAYFTRHDKDQNARNFGNDDNPSRGYLAWLNWGGYCGLDWAKEEKELMRENPMYPRRRNIFGWFTPKPSYYVYEGTLTGHSPLNYAGSVEEYLENMSYTKAFDLNHAINRANTMLEERKTTKRGGNLVFVVEKLGDEYSFIDWQTKEKKSFADFQEEFAQDLETLKLLNPRRNRYV